MQVLFKARSPEALALRDLVVSRTQFAMRRLRWLVPRARVHLDDVNGPRGGVDKRCRIEMQAPTGGPVVITSLATDWRWALDAALKRVVRTLLRSWRRHRTDPAPFRPQPRRIGGGHK